MSLEIEDNPYAPPQTNVQSLPDSRLWKIEGNDLWVRNGASFPDVDLVTGEICSDKPKLRSVGLQNPFATILFLVVVVPMLFMPELVRTRWGISISLWWLLVPLILSSPFWPSKMRYARITCARSGKKAQTHWKKGILFTGLGLVLLGIATGFMAVQKRDSVMVLVALAIVVAGILAFLAAIIWNGMKRSQVRCAEIEANWFRLRDISPVVIEHLRRTEQQIHRSARDPNIWIYSVDLTRYPMSEWCRVLKWNPIACLNIFLRKFVQRTPLVMQGSIKRDPSMVSPEVISEKFRGEVEEFRQRLEPKGWALEGWQRVRVQGFDAWTEEATFLHSDGRSSLSLVITDGSPFKRRMALVLLSWTQDGRILRTITQPEFAGFIPEVKVMRVKGGTKEVMKLHEKRIAEEKCIRLQGIHEWAHRAHEIHLRSHAYMYERGIYGPLES